MTKFNYLQNEQILIKIKPKNSIHIQTELSPKIANINKNQTPDFNICTNRTIYKKSKYY